MFMAVWKAVMDKYYMPCLVPCLTVPTNQGLASLHKGVKKVISLQLLHNTSFIEGQYRFMPPHEIRIVLKYILTIQRPYVGRQGMGCINSTQRQGRARHRPHFLVGAGVGIRTGSSRGLVARRVRRYGYSFMRRVEIRHWRQGPRALPVARNLNPGNSPQQAEPGSSRHNIRARAGRECPRPRTLSPVGSARLCAHIVTQNHLSRIKRDSETTPGCDTEGRHRMLRGFKARFGTELTLRQQTQSMYLRREIVNSHEPSHLLLAKFWQLRSLDQCLQMHCN